jgi:hypothetical protein
MEGSINKLVMGIVFVIVGFVVVFYIVGALAPTITTASGNISGSGLPLAGLFSSSGVLLIILMVAIFIALLLLAFKLFKDKA